MVGQHETDAARTPRADAPRLEKSSDREKHPLARAGICRECGARVRVVAAARGAPVASDDDGRRVGGRWTSMPSGHCLERARSHLGDRCCIDFTTHADSVSNGLDSCRAGRVTFRVARYATRR